MVARPLALRLPQPSRFRAQASHRIVCGDALRRTRRAVYVLSDGGVPVACVLTGGSVDTAALIAASEAQWKRKRRPRTVAEVAPSGEEGDGEAEREEGEAGAAPTLAPPPSPAPESVHPVEPDATPVTVEAVAFTGPGSAGDFAHLSCDPNVLAETLFVYNDNAEQFLTKWDGSPGGGNAVVRPLRLTGDACGVPTGTLCGGGFRDLSQWIWNGQEYVTVSELIDEAFDEITRTLRANPRKSRVVYSGTTSERGAAIGTGIFWVAPDVRDYITARLQELRTA